MRWTDKVLWLQNSLPFMVPALILTSGILLLLALTGMRKVGDRLFRIISLAALAAPLIWIVTSQLDAHLLLAAGVLRLDGLAVAFQILILSGGMLTVAMGSDAGRVGFAAEYHILLLAACLGGLLLTMSVNLLMVVLSLEMISIPSYLLTGFRQDRHAAEGSLKYFLFGAAITAVALFGISLLFGVTGTLDFSTPAFAQGLLGAPMTVVATGGLMVVAALLFKMASAPFHFWAPDVYEVSPTPIAAFFSVVPKLAGAAVLCRLSIALHAYGQSAIHWQTVLSTFAILTIVAGNLAALAQQQVRRLMAYSSIAQAGFLLIGVVLFSPDGISTLVFYCAVLLSANFLAFGMLDHFEHQYGFVTIRDFRGQGGLSRTGGVLLSLALFSLVGLPPAAGFTAKLFILLKLVEAARQTDQTALYVLLAVSLGGTVVSLFYYLKIPFALYLQPRGPEAGDHRKTLRSAWLGGLLAALLLILFLQPALLTQWLNRLNFAF